MRSRRFLVPVGVAGLIAAGTAVPNISSASAATPKLPAITAQQLVVKAEQAKVAGLSGTVKLSPDLGLPDISSLTGGDGQSVSSAGFDPTSLLTGTTTFQVWDAGSSEQRLALAPSAVTEIDVVRNGSQLWTSDSTTQRVTHYVAAAGGHRPGAATHVEPQGTPPTPEQAAQDFLSSITPTTDVSVVTPVYVAGRPTYELRLAPKAADSTVQSVTIAVDSATGLPLRVQVTPKGSTTPALSLGYTSISFSVPSAGTFAPLVGASEVTKTIGGHGQHMGRGGAGAHTRRDPAAHQARPDRAQGEPTTTGTGWGTIVTAHTAALTGANPKELDAASSAVTLGNGTTARLVTTSLLNALVLPDGTVVAGFVTPAALEAAAASAS